MGTPQQKPKYLLLSLIGALVVAGGMLLALTPSAQAQETPPQCSPSESLCIDKTVTPNPVQVGQTLTFEIELTERIGITLVEVTDVLPASVEFVSASPPCNLVGNTVECFFILVRSETITIQVIARECGTFPNTATAATPVQTVSDTEEFTVECAPPPPPPPPPPTPTPAAVCPEVAQGIGIGEAQSADAEPETEISNAGDSTNLTAAPLQQSNTGNVQNAQGVNQCAVGESGDIELSGSSLEMSPELEAASEQTIEQAAAS